MAFTTLLTQCIPYLRPVPTVLPTTFTNPSLPHPLEVPEFHLNFHTRIARCLSSAPHPQQVLSRTFWRYNIYGISGTITSMRSPRAPARLLGAGSHVRSVRPGFNIVGVWTRPQCAVPRLTFFQKVSPPERRKPTTGYNPGGDQRII